MLILNNLFKYFYFIEELYDAYLNKIIDHKTCIEIVLYAYFFLNIWKKYIEHCSI